LGLIYCNLKLIVSENMNWKNQRSRRDFSELRLSNELHPNTQSDSPSISRFWLKSAKNFRIFFSLFKILDKSLSRPTALLVIWHYYWVGGDIISLIGQDTGVRKLKCSFILNILLLAIIERKAKTHNEIRFIQVSFYPGSLCICNTSPAS